MNYSMTERKVLKMLKIPDFNHMSKDKVVKFVSLIPKMDPEVAKLAISQFPEFKDLSSKMIDAFKQTIDSILEKNGDSQRAFYDACNLILESLKNDLESSDDREVRDRIEDKMIQVAVMIGEKDSENKQFYKWIVGMGGGVFILTVGIGSLLLGNKIIINGQDASCDDTDDNMDE